jgi:hypothetical protein
MTTKACTAAPCKNECCPMPKSRVLVFWAACGYCSCFEYTCAIARGTKRQPTQANDSPKDPWQSHHNLRVLRQTITRNWINDQRRNRPWTMYETFATRPMRQSPMAEVACDCPKNAAVHDPDHDVCCNAQSAEFPQWGCANRPCCTASYCGRGRALSCFQKFLIAVAFDGYDGMQRNTS